MFIQEMTRVLLLGKVVKARLGRYQYVNGKVCIQREPGGTFDTADTDELKALYLEGGATVESEG